MDQFVEEKQVVYYNMTRPKYTREIFDEIIKNTRGFDNYLDVACGTGQLLLPLSKYLRFRSELIPPLLR